MMNFKMLHNWSIAIVTNNKQIKLIENAIVNDIFNKSRTDFIDLLRDKENHNEVLMTFNSFYDSKKDLLFKAEYRAKSREEKEIYHLQQIQKSRRIVRLLQDYSKTVSPTTRRRLKAIVCYCIESEQTQVIFLDDLLRGN